MEAEAVGSNDFNLQNHLKKRKGEEREKDYLLVGCCVDDCFGGICCRKDEIHR